MFIQIKTCILICQCFWSIIIYIRYILVGYVANIYCNSITRVTVISCWPRARCRCLLPDCFVSVVLTVFCGGSHLQTSISPPTSHEWSENHMVRDDTSHASGWTLLRHHPLIKACISQQRSCRLSVVCVSISQACPPPQFDRGFLACGLSSLRMTSFKIC